MSFIHEISWQMLRSLFFYHKVPVYHDRKAVLTSPSLALPEKSRYPTRSRRSLTWQWTTTVWMELLIWTLLNLEKDLWIQNQKMGSLNDLTKAQVRPYHERLLCFSRGKYLLWRFLFSNMATRSAAGIVL